MSSVRSARIGTGIVFALSGAAVFLVHQQQKSEAVALHEGVAKDAVRMKWRKAEIEKQQKLEADQPAHNQPTPARR